MYVDDILIAGDDALQVQQFINVLHQQFSLKHLGQINYFLGLEAHVTPHSIFLSQ